MGPTPAKEISEIIEALRGAASVLIVTHEHPDADAVASALALSQALESAGKPVAGATVRAYEYIQTFFLEFFSFLPGMVRIIKPSIRE